MADRRALALDRRHGPDARSIRSVLAIVDGAEDDRRVLRSACGLAAEHVAKLTLMYVWSPPRLVWFSGLGGPWPAELIAEQERDAARRLHRVASEVPCDVPCAIVCRRGRADARGIKRAADGGRHDCVVVADGTLSRRSRTRLLRLEGRPQVVLVGVGDRCLVGEPGGRAVNPAAGRVSAPSASAFPLKPRH
jgi:hypothetical protein